MKAPEDLTLPVHLPPFGFGEFKTEEQFIANKVAGYLARGWDIHHVVTASDGLRFVTLRRGGHPSDCKCTVCKGKREGEKMRILKPGVPMRGDR